ncbi:hypothetical protein [Pectobacterium brasiliense]|uniref:hypothetical protein n=1 Tax=Pectobacterium brasiliense TaxID=180957 RepID=UPI001F0770CA|nr:hypothetical protein [Pectobacterium brasiliense]
MNVVRDKDLLGRRIKYYIESGRGGRQSEATLIQALSQHGRLYVFGGLIRDIGLYTAHQFHSDIDLVFVGSKKQLEEALSERRLQEISENKFGGFRVKGFTVDIDIWSLEETWAFKQGIFPKGNIEVEDLLHTTLMTWDSVLYDIQNSRIITTDSWLNDLRVGRLDLVLERTPDVSSALVRILRTIYGKDVLVLGERLCQFLATLLNRHSDQVLIHNEFKSFRTNHITSKKLSILRQDLERWPGRGDIQVNPHQWHEEQLELEFVSPIEQK